MIRFRLRSLLAFSLAVLALASCAPKPVVQQLPSGQAWAGFRERQRGLGPAPAAFSLDASLYITAKGQTHRTILRFWGDAGKAWEPLRLDVEAGIGSPLAYFRETRAGWIAFYPNDNKAFLHDDPTRALPALGLNVPFGLRDLALLLAGRVVELLPAEPSSQEQLPDGGTVFRFSPPSRISSVRLDETGRPLALTGRGETPWSVVISGYGDARDFGPASKFDFDLPPGQRGVLRVRQANTLPEPWPDTALGLELPDGSERIRLDDTPRPAS